MADSVTCDNCGKVAARASTGNWHKVSLHHEPSNPVWFGRVSGDYCTLDCLIKKAKARRRADRQSRANYHSNGFITGTHNLATIPAREATP